MIKIKQISKRYQTNNVLDNVSMELEEGLCTALIGKNGAGKSTLIDIIIGHIKPDKGIIEDPHSIIQPKNIGILFQKTNFPKSVKVKELYSLFKGVYRDGMSFEQFQNMTRFSDKMMNQYANDLSGGQKRLLDFILCLIGNPQLLILDEPTTAMDIETRERFWNIILKLKKEGTTILYTSHYIEEVERMADKITLLENGVVKFSGLHNEIIHNQNYSIIEFPISSEEQILELQSKFKVEVNDNTIKLKTNKVQDVINELLNLKINFNEMIISKQSLLEMMFEQEREIMMNSTGILLKIELNSILRRKLTTFMAILLPLAFYLLFTSILDLPEEAKKQFNKDYMYSMTTFSLINFCLMQFPFGMIEEKTNGWYKRLTTIPIAPSTYFLAKVLKTMLLFLCSIVLIFSVAHFYKDVTLEASQWILSGLVLWVGASLFLTLGLVIAQFNDIQKASSIANLLNIGMAILGGLWFPTNTFPDWLQTISKWMPTYQLKQVAIELSKGHSIPVNSSLLLIVYSIVFLIIALLINKKKEVK